MVVSRSSLHVDGCILFRKRERGGGWGKVSVAYRFPRCFRALNIPEELRQQTRCINNFSPNVDYLVFGHVFHTIPFPSFYLAFPSFHDIFLFFLQFHLKLLHNDFLRDLLTSQFHS